jgi:hypothetical protein
MWKRMSAVPCIVAAFFGFLLITAGRPVAAVTVTNVHTGPDYDEYLIEEPEVTGVDAAGEPITYPQIKLAPGDTVVVVHAGGCVSRSGLWIPYATGTDSRATIYVSGTAQFLNRKRMVWTVIGEPLSIDKDFPAKQLVFQLGFAKAGDPISYDQPWNLAGNTACDLQWPRIDPVTGQPSPKRTAFVHVRVTHGTVQATVGNLKDFDIVPVHGFRGKLPMNPIWGFQAKGCGLAGTPKLDSQGTPFRSWKDCRPTPEPHCKTDFHDATSLPFARDSGVWCHFSPDRIDFYQNPVVYYGSMDFEDNGYDDDYSLNLHSEAGELYTSDGDRVHFEQDGDETIYIFGDHNHRLGANDWWVDFNDQVRTDEAQARTWFASHGGGSDPFGVVVGLPALDCYHTGGIEIHPAMAMAVRIRKFDPATGKPEQWAFYYRNFGNNGFCGDTTYTYAGEGGIYTLLLPQPPAPVGKVVANANPVGGAVTFWMGGGSAPSTPWKLEYAPGQGTLVTIRLPRPTYKHAGIAGIIEVSYSFENRFPTSTQLNPCVVAEALGKHCTTMSPMPAPPSFDDEGEMHEKRSLFLQASGAARRPVYATALRLLEKQIGFRLTAPEAAGVHMTPAPLSCSMDEAPVYDASADEGPVPNPTPRHSALMGTFCALFQGADGFPSELCEAGLDPRLAKLPECRDCDSPGLLRYRRDGRGVLAGWALRDRLAVGETKAFNTADGSLLLRVESLAGPGSWNVRLDATEEALASLFSVSDLALVRLDAAGGLFADPVSEPDILEREIRRLASPAGGSTIGMGTCPARPAEPSTED